MKKILIIGAGKSSSYLIKYLLEHSLKKGWQLTVADMSLELAKQKTVGYPKARAIKLDSNNEIQRKSEIEKSDIVISMLPAFMHYSVASDCILYKKHLVTASYVSKEILSLDAAAKKANVLLLNEMGLDPGIDHMSAMQIIDRIKKTGEEIISFKSYCGGLVAPESNDNPWGYKFSWNPRNVILAGQGTAKFIERGKYKYIPYNRLFKLAEIVKVEGHGKFDAYANRDSLSYRKPYRLQNIPTMLRGTLRMPGYCRAWDAFVKLGLTDDSYIVEQSDSLTYNQLLEAFLPPSNKKIKARLADFIQEKTNSEVIKKIEWLGLLEDKKIKLANATPAQILQNLLEETWKLKETDKDMVVMQHEFEIKSKGRNQKIISSLVVIGENQQYTAMAKTVGLPMAIAVKLILENKIKMSGVVIPTIKEMYEPVLKELESFGIKFREIKN